MWVSQLPSLNAVSNAPLFSERYSDYGLVSKRIKLPSVEEFKERVEGRPDEARKDDQIVPQFISDGERTIIRGWQTKRRSKSTRGTSATMSNTFASGKRETTSIPRDGTTPSTTGPSTVKRCFDTIMHTNARKATSGTRPRASRRSPFRGCSSYPNSFKPKSTASHRDANTTGPVSGAKQ